jgi:hypothetical protein
MKILLIILFFSFNCFAILFGCKSEKKLWKYSVMNPYSKAKIHIGPDTTHSGDFKYYPLGNK